MYCGISTRNLGTDINDLEKCTAAVERWFLQNGMLLNADKSDVVVLSTAQQASKLPIEPVVNIAGADIRPSASTRSLGVVIDERLTLNKYVNSISQSCYYHIRAVRHIHRFLTDR